jgi:hypothetical protein
VVTQFKLLSADANPLDPLRDILRKTVALELIDLLCESAIGMAKERADALIRTEKPGMLDADEFRATFIRFIQKTNIPGLLSSFAPVPADGEVAAVLSTRPVFIRQLEIIEVSEDDRVRAVSDFLRTSATVWRTVELKSACRSLRGRTTILAVRGRGVPSMCDYSLYGVASRPAKVGDKLVSTKFAITGGFAAVGEPNVAVCLLPGTEVAFDTEVAFEKEVEFESISGRYPNWKAETKLGEKVARFRQLHKNEPHKHHDALEFADGQIVLVTWLCEGQEATVLQLPAAPRTATEVEEQKRVIVVA